jgi:Tol biopolymer transport system component
VPVWSHDGRYLAYSSRDQAKQVDIIARKPADGSGEQEVLLSYEESVPRNPASFTPDGTGLIYSDTSNSGSGGIRLLSLKDGTTSALVQVPGAEWGPALSPNGKWLAYVTDEAGDPEVYVRSMSEGGRWQVSEGGNTPRWSPDGKELFYVDGTRFYVVDVPTESTFSHGRPRLLFELDHVSSPGTAAFDVAPDGSRLLVVRHTSLENTTGHLNVVINWVAGLEGS